MVSIRGGAGGGGGNLPHSIIGIQAMHVEGEGGYLLGSKGCRERMKRVNHLNPRDEYGGEGSHS